MSVTRAEKESALEQFEGKLDGAGSVILVDYRGLKVPEVTELRRQVRGARGGYRVIKNTLARRAIKGTKFEALQPYFEGTVAVAFSEADPVTLAKVLTTFAKTAPNLTIKAAARAGTGAAGVRSRRTGLVAGQASAVRQVAVCPAGTDGAARECAERRAARPSDGPDAGGAEEGGFVDRGIRVASRGEPVSPAGR